MSGGSKDAEGSQKTCQHLMGIFLKIKEPLKRSPEHKPYKLSSPNPSYGDYKSPPPLPKKKDNDRKLATQAGKISTQKYHRTII